LPGGTVLNSSCTLPWTGSSFLRFRTPLRTTSNPRDLAFAYTTSALETPRAVEGLLRGFLTSVSRLWNPYLWVPLFAAKQGSRSINFQTPLFQPLLPHRQPLSGSRGEFFSSPSGPALPVTRGGAISWPPSWDVGNTVFILSHPTTHFPNFGFFPRRFTLAQTPEQVCIVLKGPFTGRPVILRWPLFHSFFKH